VKLNKPLKILVAVGTAWLILYPLLFIAVWFSMMSGFLFADGPEPPVFISSLFSLIFPFHCLTIILQFALMGFYLFHVIKNTAASDVVRVVFGVGTFFMPYIAMPVYYFLFIWREHPPEWALAKEAKSEPKAEGDTIQNVQSTSPIQPGISKKNLAIIGGVIGVVVLICLILGFLFIRFIVNFNQTVLNEIGKLPTPVTYEKLQVYDSNEKAFYQPVESTSFTPLNTFKEIYTWSDYNQDPILIVNNTIFIAGHAQKPSDSWGGGINVDLISADINTGKVNWQAQTGSPFLLKDEKQIYAEAVGQFGAAGMAAYDINTGEQNWETRFDYDYAAGIGHVALTEAGMTVETYSHGNLASFLVDKETGKIKETHKDTSLYAVDEEQAYNGIILEKQGYGVPDTITARNKADGSIIWQFDQEPVVSNIAVGGPITYFLTENARLIALDTNTGEVLGRLSFAPHFAHDFDFINTSLIVAADKDIVAVYFEDSRQISIFRFNKFAQ
jgi:outer membrane protein assembly factor BamB